MHKDWLECAQCGTYWRGVHEEVDLCSQECAESYLEGISKVTQDKESQAKPGRL
jgi:hypothetical protein